FEGKITIPPSASMYRFQSVVFFCACFARSTAIVATTLRTTSSTSTPRISRNRYFIRSRSMCPRPFGGPYKRESSIGNPLDNTTAATNKKFKGFTDEERAAMKEYVQEMKASAQRGPRPEKADGESALLTKIAEMPEPDRAMAKLLHAIIKASAPALSPKTWYGMPAYAKDGEVVCFFQPAQKFKTRYATLGFSD